MHSPHRYSAVTTLVACLGISLLLMSSPENLVSRSLQSMASPFQKGLASFLNGSSDIWFRYLYLVDTQERYEDTRRELSRLRLQAVEWAESEQELKRLRRLLGFQRNLGREALAARIIGWDSTELAQSFLCDRGTRDGVQANMCVVTDSGLVGRVLQVTERTSQVQLVFDELSHVAVRVQRNRLAGILAGRGPNRKLELKYIPKDADIQVGDVLVASGLDGIYHRGLLVGFVTSIDNNGTGMFQHVLVEPSVDLDRVEEVLIFLAEQNERELPGIEEAALELTPTQDSNAPTTGEESEGVGVDSRERPEAEEQP